MLPMHPAYAAGRMPFAPPMMPFYGQMLPHFMPPMGVGMPPYVSGPAGYPFMPPSSAFPPPFASMASLSTVASSVTPTSVVWAGVAHPMPSATVQSSSASDVRSSPNVQSSSVSASSPAVTTSVSQPNIPPAFAPDVPPQAAASAPASTSRTGNSENTPVTTVAAAAERDNDPVLSASELRRRQRTSPPVTVRSVRQPAELPATASSQLSRLFGNVILIVLIVCICLLLGHRLCMISSLL